MAHASENDGQPRRAVFDVGLLVRARAGSRSALGALLDGCRDYLTLVANAELPAAIRAKIAPSDLVQQSLAEAVESFGGMNTDSEQELLRWLRTILSHNIADAQKSFATGKRNVQIEQAIDSGCVDQLDSPSHCAMRSEDRARIEAALALLPERYRQVVVLRNLQERRFSEIGALMNLTEDSARKLWERAIRRLSDQMRSKYAESADRPT